MFIDRWFRLREFIAKYAAAGTKIRVFWLHQQRDELAKTAELTKGPSADVSLPGCTLDFLNGMRLPSFIDSPYASAEAKHLKVGGWIKAIELIAKAIKDTHYYEKTNN